MATQRTSLLLHQRPSAALCALLAQPDSTTIPSPSNVDDPPPHPSTPFNTTPQHHTDTTSLRKAVSALLHEVSDATSLPPHFNLEALTQSVSDRIAPQLAFLDHHDPGPGDFLDCVFNAVANEPFTTKQHPDDPTTYKQLLTHPNLDDFRKVMLDELLQLFDVFHAFTPVTLTEAQAAKAKQPDT